RNVMIGRDGRVFVLDFGLALANWESRISSTGTTLGTVPYMAPEILLQQDADARSDLYGLGVVLYEALTGTVPHGKERSAGAAYNTIHSEPMPPSKRRPEISEAVEQVVLKAIAREPGARHQSAADLLDELRAVEMAVSTSEPVVHPPRVVSESREPRDPSEVTRPYPLYLAIRPVTLASIGQDREGEAAAAARHLSDFLTSALSRYTGIRIVPPGTEVANGDEPREIARSLGANAILAASISRSGPRLRMAYQVLDPWRDLVIVGDVVEGAVGQVFDLADAVVKSIADALGLRLPQREPLARPSDPAARDRYATALGYLKRYDDDASLDGAIRLLEGLVASEGESAQYHATLSRAFVHKYRLTWQRVWESRAAAACERAKSLAPDAPETLLALGDLKWVTGRPEEARADYERALEKYPDLFEAYIGLSRALESLGRSDEAKAAIERAIVTRPNDWRGHNRLGIHFFDRGENANAAKAWRQVTALAPDQARGWFNLAGAFYRLNQTKEAVQNYEKSIEIQPTALAYGSLGTVLYHLQRFEEAVVALRRATEMNPLDAFHWGNLGNAYRWMPGCEVDSSRALERAIELGRDQLSRNPDDVMLRARLAGWLANRGCHREAREAIESALRRAPQNPDCMVRAGHVFFQLGDRDEALRWIRQAVTQGYGVEELRASIELAPLRSDPEFTAILDETPE
ncbi:MAG TPA: tetratricopeptide repeat protein, partial [Candidatus Eisenbacteria bacterium]|nr:tetratricopeptide repeat protein [Candidatus Eisenbacteria bacterium]